MPLPLLVPAFALIMASLALAARADMDHAAEARRAAQRQEAAHQAAQQKSRDEATKKAAMARGYRGMLGAKAAGRHAFDWDASKYTGSTDALQFRVTAVNGSTKLDSTPLSLSKVTAAGAEDGQLVLSLSNGKTINYSQIKALV